MATGDLIGSRQHASEDLAGSFSAGSEESFTYECDACKVDGNIKEASYYCTNCEDLLCDDCESYHRKVKATRFHEILRGDSMPPITTTKTVGKQMKEQKLKTCVCNQDRAVDFYCSDHDDVVCSVCKNVLHKKCNTATVKESCEKIQISEVFKNTSEKISTLLGKAQQSLNKNNENCNTVVEMETKCRDEIKQFRNKINSLMDKLEENALAELRHQIAKQSAIMKDREETISSTLELVKADHEECKEVLKENDHQTMFSINNKINKRLNKYELALKESGSQYYHSIEFEKNNDLLNVITIGKVISLDKMVHEEVTKPALLDAEVKTHKIVDVKQRSDKKKPWITGIAFLPNDELLIADKRNHRITWFNRAMNLRQSKKCPGEPLDVAVINEREVVVTQTKEHMLLFIQIGPELTFGRSIELNEPCYGVTVIQDQLCVTVGNVIQVLDMKGNIKKQIRRSSLDLYYIASNKQGDKLFISEVMQLTCISTSGILLFTVSDQSLRGPRGVIVDKENNILVCCRDSNNIGIIKPDGTLHKVLLKQESQIPGPYSIDYRVSDGLVAVGSYEDGFLHILTLA